MLSVIFCGRPKRKGGSNQRKNLSTVKPPLLRILSSPCAWNDSSQRMRNSWWGVLTLPHSCYMPGLQPQKKRSTSFIDHYFTRYKNNKTTGADEHVYNYTVEMPTPGFLCPSCQKCCGNAGALATHMKAEHS